MPPLSYDQALAAVRAEIQKYYDDEFSEDDKLIDDLKIDSDDLSAMALALEKNLKIKLRQDDYDKVCTAANWAQVIHEKAASSGP